MDLDRGTDGVERRCDECGRTFKASEGWMDWCAECHAESERTSPLNKRWACLNCNTTFRLGSAKPPPTPGDGFECPNCKSGNTHPADGEVRQFAEYHGEIGTKN